jgi:hypothetical protein
MNSKLISELPSANEAVAQLVNHESSGEIRTPRDGPC